MKARSTIIAVIIIILVMIAFVIETKKTTDDGMVEQASASPTVGYVTTTKVPVTTTTVDPVALADFYEAVAAGQTTTTTAPVKPLAPPCSTWATQQEADAWMAENFESHNTSNIDTNGDSKPCTRHFAPPPVPPTPAVQATSGGGGCAIPSYICQRESGGNPNAVNRTGCSGRGCYGKYQFDPRTWDSVVRDMGRPDLVGNYLASEADQDAAAAHLWNGGSGCGHWASC